MTDEPTESVLVLTNLGLRRSYLDPVKKKTRSAKMKVKCKKTASVSHGETEEAFDSCGALMVPWYSVPFEMGHQVSSEGRYGPLVWK